MMVNQQIEEIQSSILLTNQAKFRTQQIIEQNVFDNCNCNLMLAYMKKSELKLVANHN